jgi:hypothetical protein
LDPSQAVGSQLGFTQIDQLTGNAPTYQNQITAASPSLVNGVQVWNLPVAATVYSNQQTDFDNEYVWHCHILGHEENDFMRPFIFHPAMAVPDAPGAVTVNGSTITWTDPTPFGGQDAQGVPTAGLNATGAKVSSPKNEVGFQISGIVDATGNPVATIKVPANSTSWTDATGLLNLAGATVVAYNSAGSSPQGTASTSSVGSATNAGSALAFNAAGQPILDANGNQMTVAQVAAAAVTNAAVATATTSSAAAATAAATAATAAAATATTNTAANTALAAAAGTSPVAFGVAQPAVTTAGSISLTWANNPLNVSPTGYTNVTGYSLSWSGASAGTTTLPVTAHGVTVNGLTSAGGYTFSLYALAPAGNSTAVTTAGTAP